MTYGIIILPHHYHCTAQNVTWVLHTRVGSECDLVNPYVPVQGSECDLNGVETWPPGGVLLPARPHEAQYWRDGGRVGHMWPEDRASAQTGHPLHDIWQHTTHIFNYIPVYSIV